MILNLIIEFQIETETGLLLIKIIEDLCIRYLCGAQQQTQQIQDGQEFEKVKKRFRQENVKRSAKPVYTPDVEKKLDVARRLFKRYDSDGSGYLNDNEISGLIKDTFAEMGMNNYTPNTEDVRIWLQMADTNNDGTVSLDEYEELVIRGLKNAGIKIEQQRIVF
ncbi:hypothetical protein IMG5_103540 [Ichthyophthirius multifiliis]|uniref:EF-hand domain-containing protein n=1 Tax=Ichthyophthirius multifiliis TaxID=5932 RepID=G0QSU3_ICHMU|nr:hypothetical protein IMG5_103540 [Ichthyophthirius multifiliis]EGR31710.1 hypothetical protein IMG5_103540 [Ichthyophthirius multifiliis]|eukprot:XP_004035196.1 hypothetical protein IMG5_103540 [Ichthyophthirius multifiliis]